MPPTLDIIKAVRLPFIDGNNKKVKEPELSKIFLSRTESEKFVADVRNALSQEGTLIGLNGMIKFLKGLQDIVESGDTSPLMGYGIPPVKEEDEGTDKDSIRNILFVIRRVLISLEDRKRQARVSAGQAGGKIGGVKSPTKDRFMEMIENPSIKNIVDLSTIYQQDKQKKQEYGKLLLSKKDEIIPLLESEYKNGITLDDYRFLFFKPKEDVPPNLDKHLKDLGFEKTGATYIYDGDDSISIRDELTESVEGDFSLMPLAIVSLLKNVRDLNYEIDIVYNNITGNKAKEYFTYLDGKDGIKEIIPKELIKNKMVKVKGTVSIDDSLLNLVRGSFSNQLNEFLDDMIESPIMSQSTKTNLENSFITTIRNKMDKNNEWENITYDGKSMKTANNDLKQKYVREKMEASNSTIYSEYQNFIKNRKKKEPFFDYEDKLENLLSQGRDIIGSVNFKKLKRISRQKNTEKRLSEFMEILPTLEKDVENAFPSDAFSSQFSKKIGRIIFNLKQTDENIYDIFTRNYRVAQKVYDNEFIVIINGLITLDKTIGSDTKLDGILAKIQKQEFDVELANELSDEIQKSIPKNVRILQNMVKEKLKDIGDNTNYYLQRGLSVESLSELVQNGYLEGEINAENSE